MRDLVARMMRLCDEQPFSSNWYLKCLSTGEAADRGGEAVVPSASTRKTSIMMAALKAVNEGRFSLEQPARIEARYQKNNSGTFQHLTPGFCINFRDALVMMIIVSDNTCTGTVADMVGIDVINDYCRAIGMTNTIHRYGLPPEGVYATAGAPTTTTANDQGLLLDLILKGTTDPAVASLLGCTTELCSLGLQILSWQKLRTRLPSLLPAGTVVAHKTGTGTNNYNDAGIVYQGDRPLFILAAYTGHVPVELPDGTPGFAAAASLIGRLARMSYDALRC